MTFTFFGKKFEVTEVLRNYAEEKISKLDKFFRGDSDANVTFRSGRGKFTAEITISNNGMYYRVSETTSDMRASIDSAVAALERQIRKNKTRLEKRLRDGAFERSIAEVDADANEDDGSESSIVRTKRFSVKPMPPEEAVLQMELLGHDFFVFKNSDSDGEFSVVYKRKAGGYGLIAADDVS